MSGYLCGPIPHSPPLDEIETYNYRGVLQIPHCVVIQKFLCHYLYTILLKLFFAYHLRIYATDLKDLSAQVEIYIYYRLPFA